MSAGAKSEQGFLEWVFITFSRKSLSQGNFLEKTSFLDYAQNADIVQQAAGSTRLARFI